MANPISTVHPLIAIFNLSVYYYCATAVKIFSHQHTVVKDKMQGPGNTEIVKRFPFCNKVLHYIKEIAEKEEILQPRVKIIASICSFEKESADLGKDVLI